MALMCHNLVAGALLEYKDAHTAPKLTEAKRFLSIMLAIAYRWRTNEIKAGEKVDHLVKFEVFEGF